MKDLKMAELKFEAPLAKFETEDWLDFSEFQGSEDIANSNKRPETTNKQPGNENGVELSDNFTETYSGSLEDLVNTFDEKITECFKNYEEKTEKFAPVQVRTQEELMNECPMWWTITGNYGNILPIDWSKTYARSLHIPALHLKDLTDNNNDDNNDNDDNEEDDLLGQQLDMHSMIISSLHQEPMMTAEDVLEEIDDMLTDSPSSDLPLHDSSSQAALYSSKGSADLSALTLSMSDGQDKMEERLQSLSIGSLYELLDEIESEIRVNSETLVQELAQRDEGEYEKEMKNQFISLLLSVQGKRRQVQTVPGSGFNSNMNNLPNAVLSNARTTPGTYLTTVIPYHMGHGPPSLHTLQILIKILMAINDDSPSVPGLLTDYILKVLCPTTA